MQPETLHEASYRGVFFFVTSVGTTGGRKDSKKEILDSDRVIIDDFGKRRRVYTFDGVVSARYSSQPGEQSVTKTYQQAKAELLKAFELGSTGVLIHPFDGRIENVACRNFTLNERLSQLGESTFSVTFEVSDLDGLPQIEEAVLGSVEAKNEAAWTASNEAVEDLYEVTPSNVSNSADAIEKVNDFLDSVRDATAPFEQVADELDAFTKELSDIATNAASLVTTPLALAESIQGVFETIGALLLTPSAVFESMKRLFDFGLDDINFFPVDTAERIERQQNRNTFNAHVRNGALNNAYLLAAQLDLATVEAIDETLTVLEDQYQAAIEDGSLGADVETALNEVRITLIEYFNAQRATKPRLIDIKTATIPARVLAYSYYGSTEQGYAIAELNGFTDPSFVEGDIQVLSS